MDTTINTEEVKEQILDAADERFTQYGYNKTTMAEIAKDCCMSAANLYRYFDNKLDIGAGLACRCLAEDENNIRSVTDKTNLSAADKLKLYLQETLRHTYEQWSKRPKINELVQAVSQERPDIVQKHREIKKSVLVQILQHGNDTGEFDVSKPDVVADSILFAIIALDVPFFMHMYSLKEFQFMAEGLGQLLLNGVLKR